MSMHPNIRDELFIFLRRPGTFLDTFFLTTRGSSHDELRRYNDIDISRAVDQVVMELFLSVLLNKQPV